MKKILTFAAALLLAVGAMATSYEWETLDNLGLTFSSSDNAVTVRSTTNGVYESKGLYDNANQYGIKIANSANANLDTSYIEIRATGEISALELGFSSNGSSAKNYVVAFSSESPFDKDNLLGQEVAAACAKTGTKESGIHSFTVPTGTQSVRIYRKAKISGTDYGEGSTVYMYYLNVTVGAATVKHTVSYYDGATLLGTEKVAEGSAPAKYADYQSKLGYTFNGWYNEAGFTSAADLTAAITANKAFYGKWTKDVVVVTDQSSSVNIEQLIVDNGKSYNIQNALTAAHITFDNIDGLDSLNSSKTANNEPFLGLKLKTAGAYFEVALKANSVLRVKFGNVPADIKVNGVTVAAATVHNVATGYEYTATVDTYVRFATTTTGTVVLKQIMVNEPIAELVMPALPNNTSLASLTLDGVAIAGFSATKKEYTIEVAEGSAIPVVAATAADSEATVGNITQATAVPGDATFVVTAADGTTTATYTIHFVRPREITYLAEADMPYETTIPADFVLPDWMTGCVVNLAYAGSDTVVSGKDVIRFEKTDTIALYLSSCDSVIVKVSATGGRTVAIAANGNELANSGSFSSKTLKTIGAYVHSADPVIVKIYGVNVSGGTTLSYLRVTAYNDTPTSLDEIETIEAQKIMINGQIYIIKNGVRYNMLGAVVE